MTWGVKDVPDQTGKIVICTGANSGLGYFFTKYMVQHGATVIAACRSVEKGEAAKHQIVKELLEEKPAGCKWLARKPATGDSKEDLKEEKEHKLEGSIDVLPLDLASLKSVAAFVEKVKEKYEKIDILCNNAGVMALDPKQTTVDGFEMQMGSNHLGHFALTLPLLPLLEKAEAPRIVNVASLAYKQTKGINFDDFHCEKSYDPWDSYGQSKLANLYFTLALNKKLKEKGSKIIAVSAHPGVSKTNLSNQASLSKFVIAFMGTFVASEPKDGALPELRAATDPAVTAGDYYGPTGLMEWSGAIDKVDTLPIAKDETAAMRLWDHSLDLTKVSFF